MSDVCFSVIYFVLGGITRRVFVERKERGDTPIIEEKNLEVGWEWEHYCSQTLTIKVV